MMRESPARPNEITAHAQARPQPRASRFVDGPLRNGALSLDAGNNAVKTRFDDDAADDHLAQGGVQRLKVEDEVQLADILEQLVQSLDIYLDEVQQGQG